VAPLVDEIPCNIVFTGVGGTGVVTVAAVLGTAAFLEGRTASIHDRLGMAQKFGPVTSHVRIHAGQSGGNAVRVPPGSADLVISGDPLTSARLDVLESLRPRHTHVLFNTDCSNVGAFATHPDLDFGVDGIRRHLLDCLGGHDRLRAIQATTLALAVCGDTIGSNMILLGAAAQLGLLPVSVDALLKAIDINGTAVAMNRLLFNHGRLAVHDPARSGALLSRHAPSAPPADVDTLMEQYRTMLVEYQDEDYGERYLSLLRRVREVETGRCRGRVSLTVAAARYYYKLLACKDEYEVARLHTAPEFRDRLAAQFEGDYRLNFHLAPPLLARRDARTGMPRKITFGPWLLPVLRGLAALRRWRGTTLDPFRFSADRKLDRHLIAWYEELVDTVLAQVTEANYDTAVELLDLPEHIRGYGPLREKTAAEAAARREQLLGMLLQDRAA